MLRACLAAALALILTTSPARAADRVALDLYWAGLDAMAASPKDAFMREAFRAIGPRILRLPTEVGAETEDARILASLWETVRARKHMRLELNDDDAAKPVVRFRLGIYPVEPEKAAELAAAVAKICDDEPLELIAEGPLRKYKTDAGELAFGVRGGAFILMLNGLEGDSLPAGRVDGAPADAPLLMRVHLNGPVLSQLLDLAPEDNPEEARKGKAALGAMGLWGDKAISVDAGMWRSVLGFEGVASVRGARNSWFPGPEAAPTLGTDFLAMVPADATCVSASVFDLSVIDRIIRAVHPDNPDQAYAEAREALGFDLKADFIDHLGPRYAWYQSDRTGGAGMMSSVALIEVRNPEAFAVTHTNIVQHINSFGAGMAKGFIRIDTLDVGGQPSFLLHAPGLPLPLAPMWTISGNTIIAGATPIAFSEALAIAREKGPSIASADAIRDRIASDGSALAGLAFADTPLKARESVGTATALLIMLSNAAGISPAATAPALPTPTELLRGVRPCVVWTTWSGQDLVYRWTADDSLTVIGAVTVSQYAKVASMQTVPLMAGILLPAMGKARVVAKEAVSSTVVSNILIGVTAWSADNADTFPPSLDALVEELFVSAEMLDSPFGSAVGSKWDYVMRTDLKDQASVVRPDQTILLIDLAAMQSGRDVHVGFVDGHVELLTREELDARLAEPQNAGMKTALGLD